MGTLLRLSRRVCAGRTGAVDIPALRVLLQRVPARSWGAQPLAGPLAIHQRARGAAGTDLAYMKQPTGSLLYSTQAAHTQPSTAESQDSKLPKRPAASNAQAMTRTLKVPDLVSPELIAEPYAGPRERLPLWSWFTPTGWRARYQRILAGVKNLYALAMCQRNIPGFSMPAFKSDVIDLYLQVNELIAGGSLTLLKREVTGKCFSLLKKELKGRDRAKWGKVVWGVNKPLAASNVEVLQARLLALDPNNTKTHFAQITVRLESNQRFAAYNSRGSLVAGDPEGDVLVEDIWVVERAVYNPDGRWVLAARLTNH